MTGASSNYRDICVIPEIALYYDGSGQHLLRASATSAALREIILSRRLRAGMTATLRQPAGAPPPSATVPLLLRNAYGSPVPGRNYFAFNYRDNCDNPEIGFACNVGFVLRFCAPRPYLWRGRLFEYVEPQPGFPTR